MSVVRIDKHANGLPRGLTDDGATQLIRELVAEGGRVAFVGHSQQRMQERDVSMDQVLQVLKRGQVTESCKWHADRQSYKLTLRALAAGDEVTVRCAIEVEALMGQVVTVITVMVD